MQIIYVHYLEKLKKTILENTDKQANLDPILITEFKKAIKRITPEYWAQIKDLFIQNITYTYSYDEQMAFTILASYLGLEFLNKEPEFCGELASILPLMQKSPLNYCNYAKIFLSNPLYNLITSIVHNIPTIGYFDLLPSILMKITNLQLTTEDYNQILRILYKLQGETYTILIDNDDTLEIIYHKILTRMIERNKKSLLYDYNSFKKLTILVNIIQENDREKCNELKQRILVIESENYTIDTIIWKILEELENFKKVITFTRRNQNGLH